MNSPTATSSRSLIRLLPIVGITGLLLLAGSWTYVRQSASASDVSPELELIQSKPGQIAPGKAAPGQVLGRWAKATVAQRQGATSSIVAQLDAFKRDDWKTAISYQSDTLRRNFKTPAQFRTVIEAKYPEFADYRTVSFGEARSVGDIVQIAVKIVGKDGVRVNAMYVMRKQRGVFRVEGVLDDSSNKPPAQRV